MSKNIFDVQVDDSSLQSKSGGKFGLNPGVRVSKFELGIFEKDGETTPIVDITVAVESREFYSRIFLSDKVYDNSNNLLSPGMEGYDQAYYDHYVQVIAVIKHYLTAFGVTKEAIDNSVRGLQSNQLQQGIQNLLALRPQNYSEIPVDVFLEYQWNIADNQERTFLTLPRNMKGGYFVCPAKVATGVWTEVKTDKELYYVDNSGNKHPFERNESFLGSNKAIQQIRGQQGASPSTPAGNSGVDLWK